MAKLERDPCDPLADLPTRDANALVRVRVHVGDVPLISFLAFAVAVVARGNGKSRDIRAAERLEQRINAAVAEYQQTATDLVFGEPLRGQVIDLAAERARRAHGGGR